MNSEKTVNIITPNDYERWPLMEMPSQICSIPLNVSEQETVVHMDQILNDLDDNAAGLAAIQIGVPRRIFLLRNSKDSNGNIVNKAYINPIVLACSKETKKSGEACLSLPGVAVRFRRPKIVTLEYTDIYGELKTEIFKDFWARAVMHEMNHLDGILITRHFEKEIAKQPRSNSFGMKLTPHRLKVIAQRRAKKKRAKSNR